MNKTSIVDSFSELKSVKSINKNEIMKILEETFRNEIIKKFKTDEGFDIILNADNGDVEVWKNKLIVEDVDFTDPINQISISEVNKLHSDFEVGEEYSEEFKIQDMGRRSILNIRQNLKSMIRDFENRNIFNKYTDMIGYIHSGYVQFVNRNIATLLDSDGVEIILEKNSQIPGEFYKKGNSVRGVIESVKIVKNKPVIYISRTSPNFLASLLEEEIPEILEGTVIIKDIVREPGIKAKVVLESYDDRIDPVGICVGNRGSRIKGVLNELNGENIDLINWTENKRLYIIRCLKISTSTNIEIFDEYVNVYVNSEEIGKIIGKNGSNIKLASNLTGLKINIFSEGELVNKDEEDIYIKEFSDEIDNWVINEFIKAGFDTARKVLRSNKSLIVEKTDLEDETVEEVIKLIKQEFEID
jgi:N utilization substance protein A